MQWVGNLSLRAKLRVIVLYSAAAAVLVAGTLYAAGEVLAQRRQQAEQLLTLVKAVAENAGFLPAPAAPQWMEILLAD